jgi:hypothetical protein
LRGARYVQVCAWTIPGGNVTEREKSGTYVGISVSDTHTDGDRNKGFRAFGGNPPKG